MMMVLVVVTVMVMMGNGVGNRGCRLIVAEAKQHDAMSEDSPNGGERQAMWPFDKGHCRQAEDEQAQMFQGSLWGTLGGISAMSKGNKSG